MKKWILLLTIYVLVIYWSYHHQETILFWINHGDMSQIYLMFPLSLFISSFPVIPFILFAGIMGAKYGLLWGAFINWFGSVSASMLFFLIARHSFANYLRAFIERFNKLDKFTKMIEKNSFIAVLFARSLHIIPPPVINIYSGISSMRITLYFAATAIGQIPGMLLYAYLGVHISSSLSDLFIGITVYISFLLIVLMVYRLWSRRDKEFRKS